MDSSRDLQRPERVEAALCAVKPDRSQVMAQMTVGTTEYSIRHDGRDHRVQAHRAGLPMSVQNFGGPRR